MVLLLVSKNDCVAFCHSEAFLLIFIVVTAFYFITAFFVSYYLTMGIHNMMLQYTLLILVRLLYGSLILLIIVLFTILTYLCLSFCQFYSSFSFTNSFIPLG